MPQTVKDQANDNLKKKVYFLLFLLSHSYEHLTYHKSDTVNDRIPKRLLNKILQVDNVEDLGILAFANNVDDDFQLINEKFCDIDQILDDELDSETLHKMIVLPNFYRVMHEITNDMSSKSAEEITYPNLVASLFYYVKRYQINTPSTSAFLKVGQQKFPQVFGSIPNHTINLEVQQDLQPIRQEHDASLSISTSSSLDSLPGSGAVTPIDVERIIVENKIDEVKPPTSSAPYYKNLFLYGTLFSASIVIPAVIGNEKASKAVSDMMCRAVSGTLFGVSKAALYVSEVAARSSMEWRK